LHRKLWTVLTREGRTISRPLRCLVIDFAGENDPRKARPRGPILLGIPLLCTPCLVMPFTLFLLHLSLPSLCLACLVTLFTRSWLSSRSSPRLFLLSYPVLLLAYSFSFPGRTRLARFVCSFGAAAQLAHIPVDQLCDEFCRFGHRWEHVYGVDYVIDREVLRGSSQPRLGLGCELPISACFRVDDHLDEALLIAHDARLWNHAHRQDSASAVTHYLKGR